MSPAAGALITPQLRAEFDRLCTLYPQRRAALIPILHRVQDVHGWISKDAMEEVAEYLGIPPVEVQGVIRFYPMFRQEPAGRHIVSVCKNISCDLMGCRDILRAVEGRFGVKPGETTAGGEFTLLTVQCLGACGGGPMMDVDGSYQENLTPDSALRILERLQ